MTFIEKGVEIASIDAPITSPKFYLEAAKIMVGAARELGDTDTKASDYHMYTFLAKAKAQKIAWDRR